MWIFKKIASLLLFLSLIQISKQKLLQDMEINGEQQSFLDYLLTLERPPQIKDLFSQLEMSNLHERIRNNLKQEPTKYQNIQANTTSQNVSDNLFTNNNLQTLIDNFFYELMNQAFFYNLDYCTTYAFKAFQYFISAIVFMAEDKMPIDEGVMQIFKGIYTGPVAYRFCYNIYVNFYELAYVYNYTIWVSYEQSLVFYAENLLFNGIDMYVEALILDRAYNTSNYAQFGTYLSKFLSDLLLKNPILKSWGYQNSESVLPTLIFNTVNQHELRQSQSEVKAGRDIHKQRADRLDELMFCVKNQFNQLIDSSEIKQDLQFLVNLYDNINQFDENKQNFDLYIIKALEKYCY